MNLQILSKNRSVSVLKTIDIELEALEALKQAVQSAPLGRAVDDAISALAKTSGKVVVTGMGKSGHIARKIAATMRSTGTPADYLHPGEASHGDMGLIGVNDVVLALTWSGETAELGDVFHYCHQRGITLIVATAFADSTAGRMADICLTLPIVREACPNKLAPTSSTMLQLAVGDALAMALIEARGFTSSDFRIFHPGGNLGAQLRTLGEIMATGDALPCVTGEETLKNATVEMSRKRFGCTAVVDADRHLVGVFTDGDLRRCIATQSLDDRIDAHMSLNPVKANAHMLASSALQLLNENAVSVLFVVEDDNRLTGIVHMHDIVRLGVV